MARRRRIASAASAFALLAIALAVAAVVAPGSGRAAVDSAGTQPARPTLVRELPELRTSDSDTYLRSDGTRVAKISRSPINYRDGNGAWQSIDTALQSGPGGTEHATSAPLTLSLPSTLSSPVTVGTAGSSVSFALEGAHGSRATSGSTASYAHVLPGVQASYTARPEGLKETLTLADAEVPTTYRYRIATSGGLKAQLLAGTVVFKDAQGRPRYVMDAPSVSDAAGGAPDSGAVRYALSKDGSRLAVVVDRTWLKDPSRQFPVRIDPTVEKWPEEGACFIANGAKANTSLCGEELYVGYEPGIPAIGRGLLQFHAERPVPEDALILGATMSAYLRHTYTSAAETVDVLPLTRQASGSMTWNTYDGTHAWTTPGGDFSTTGEAQTAVTSSQVGSRISWNVATIVEGWVRNPSSNYGVILKSDNEALNQTDEFEPWGTNAPTLEIVYSPGVRLPTYSTHWGQTGTANGQFNDPGFDAVDEKGNVWVSDLHNNRVEEFSNAGKYTRSAAAELPEGLATNPREGEIYIVHGCSTGASCVDELNSGNGKFIRSFAPKGSATGDVLNPRGAAVDLSGNVWIADENGLHKYSETGTFIGAYSAKGSASGQMLEPQGVAVDREGHVFVADAGNHRIDEFSSSGAFVRQFGTEGSERERCNHPVGIAIDPRTGELVISDQGEQRIKLFSPDGKFLGQVPFVGMGEPEFGRPEGVAIDAYGGLYISDEQSDFLDKWTLPNPELGQSGWYSTEDQNDSETTIASVNVASGNLLISEEDLPAEEESASPAITRYYNAQAVPQGGSLGARWSWGAGPDVYLTDDGVALVVHGPSGDIVTLKRGSKGSYSAPEEFEGEAVRNEDGSFTLSGVGGISYSFNHLGELTGYTDEEAHSFAVADAAAGSRTLLHTITGSSKTLEAHYNEAGTLTSTTAPDGTRKYEYGTGGLLKEYVATGGSKTTYEYDARGYLSKLKTPSGTTETFTTTTGGRVTKVLVEPAGEASSYETFSYQAPSKPLCNPKTDTGETVVTQHPAEGEPFAETYCYDEEGEITGFNGPNTEAEKQEGKVLQAETPEGTCYPVENESPEYCGAEDEGPEGEEAGELLATPRAIPALEGSRYGIADNNALAKFEYFGRGFFRNLNVSTVRRTVEWDLVTQAASGDPSAKGELTDVKSWVTKTKELHGNTGVPVISMDHCHNSESAVNPIPGGPSIPCTQAPTKEEYEAEMKAWLADPVLGKVTRFTAWNEPNLPGEPPSSKPKLAGEYWHVLNHLCVGKCIVAAGDLIDSEMKNVEHEDTTAGKWFAEYVKGLGGATHASHWAWHAYTDGENVWRDWHNRTPTKWWKIFREFNVAVNRKTHGTPNIWLTEQGVRYTDGGGKLEAGKNGHAAIAIMKAYVSDEVGQLTHLTPQIKYFYYYETCGEPNSTKNQDSGLVPPVCQTSPPKLTPRPMYKIYKQRTLHGG